MDALKLRRTPLRTAFTKAVNHLQEIIENDPVDMNAVETASEQLKQVRVKNIMKTDALGQKDNHSLVTSSSSSLRLPKIQFQQFSGESGLETESASVENSETASSSSSNVLSNQACTSEVLLQTLVVVLQNGNHKSLRKKHLQGGLSPKLNNFHLGSLTSCGQMKLIFRSMGTLIPITVTSGRRQILGCTQRDQCIPPKSQYDVRSQVPSS
ncbi:hypothetical protein TNIN_110731 [Trichonephila inaurata madagascariensis]|uniref:Uncharacterized protein n=1 Tax=Trichonephila inaurata madagascariensis TaxID=2747483 RepID=A0A8X7CQV7_9ARAC|nr:hypothetical protein TNIN_110731 [Trichonephila inaurata madagascariensis]